MEGTIMKKLIVTGLALLVGILHVSVQADLIDFESSGYVEGSSVGTVVTDTNQVTFWQSVNSTGGVFSSNIAEVGGTTEYAFRTKIGQTTYYDTPIGGSPGAYFLTDRNYQANQENYFIQFASPVTSLSLDLYDFDNGSGTAVLTGFSGTTWTGSVGTYSVSSPPGDGSVVNMYVTNPSDHILSASLTWIGGSIDDETGIDNIAFNTVPIPGAIWLMGFGLIGIIGIRRKTLSE